MGGHTRRPPSARLTRGMKVNVLRRYRKSTWAAILWTALAGYFMVSTLSNPYGQPLCGREPVPNCRNYLLPVEQTAYDRVSSGAWTHDQGLDYLVSHGAAPIPTETIIAVWLIGLLPLSAIWLVTRRRQRTTNPRLDQASGLLATPSSTTVDDRPLLERLPSSVRHPSVFGLLIAWVVAVFTVIAYPVAVYMSWRFYVDRRDGGSKVCPRCAERVKVAALVCRHCGQGLEVGATQADSPRPA
jgi:hypothetical protein